MHDNFDYRGFLEKNKLGPYAKTGKLNEAKLSQDEAELEGDFEAIYSMVEEALGNDVSDRTFQELVGRIREIWAKNRNVGQGDVYDFTYEYLMDWVADARSEGDGPSLGGGSRLSRGENDSIWSDDWESKISRATQKPEPGDDYYSDDKGSYDSNAGWQGRLEEELEENAQEDEDGDQVTNAPTEPQPIEVVSMGSNGAVIKVRKPDGTEEDVEFELDGDIEEVDPPYGYEGTIYGEIDGVEYGIAVSLVDMGGAGYDMDLSYDGLTFLEGRDPNQQEDEDGEQVTLSEEDMTGSGDDAARKANAYKRFMDALEIILGLWKQGDITEDEKTKVISAAYDTFKRLQREKED